MTVRTLPHETIAYRDLLGAELGATNWKSRILAPMLTESAIKKLKSKDRPYKRADHGGLYIEVMPNGSKLWRLKYRYLGKEKRISFGKYPAVSLKAARQKRDEAKAMLSDGLNPSMPRRDAKDTFRDVAEEWLREVQRKRTKAKSYDISASRLRTYAYPKLGGLPFDQVTPPAVLDALRDIEKLGYLETMGRVKTLIGQVCRYAIATGRCERDPTVDLRGILHTGEQGHLAAITDPERFGQFVRDLYNYKGRLLSRYMVRLQLLLFPRPNELAAMRWADIKGDVWNNRTSKGGPELLTPMPPLAVKMIDELRNVTGNREWVFTSPMDPDNHMSTETCTKIMVRIGYQGIQTAHGLRASARTILVERLDVDATYVEHQLGHTVRDPLGTAYNRAAFLDHRRDMLRVWADYIERLRKTNE